MYHLLTFLNLFIHKYTYYIIVYKTYYKLKHFIYKFIRNTFNNCLVIHNKIMIKQAITNTFYYWSTFINKPTS